MSEQSINSRIDIWETLTRANVRGILILHNFVDTEMSAIAWQVMYDVSRYTNDWKNLPVDWFREWVEQGLIVKDESYEIEKALGIMQWRDTDLYTITDKGLEQYREQFEQGKGYL